MNGESEKVKNFLLKAVFLQSREKKVDKFKLGEGVMPASFKVFHDPVRNTETKPYWLIMVNVPLVEWLLLIQDFGFDTFPMLLCADGCCMIDRRMVACGITTRPKDPVVNIDEADINNELAEVEYVEDIYTFYKLSETERGLQDYMNSTSQPDLNAKMRAILIDWLIEVHRKFELMPESLYLTINIVDRYLSVRKVPRRELQLVGISALLIACKYEEIWPPEVTDLIAISDNAFPREQILTMEKAILGHLGWFLTVPTPYVFLVRYTKASVPFDTEMENMVFFLTELGLIHYSVVITTSPSKLAASAVYAARCTLKKTPAWTETLKHHTGYYEDELRDCAKTLVTFHDCASETKLKAVYRKYANPEKGAVALFPPARDLTAEVGGGE
ncbi:putative cyclin domain, glycosyl hydrolase family 100, Cyclin-like superfamily [Helianthus anomalus]